MKTCIFCDEWGSAAYIEQKGIALDQQIQEKMNYYKTKYKSKSFLVYFQAYTSSFLGVKKLKEHFNRALHFPEVVGLILGTRPDCLSEPLIELWSEIHQNRFFSVELGVQSFFDDQLVFLRRGHTVKASIDAIHRIKSQSQVDLGIHLMFGLPGETDEQIIETAKITSSLPIDNVKLHNLHVLKNTPLADLYLRGEFQPIELEDYARRVGLFLSHLDSRIAVHRLAALSSRWDELVAPMWTRHKMASYQYLMDHLEIHGITQGQLLADQPPFLRAMQYEKGTVT